VRDGEGEGSFTGSRGTDEEQRASRELAGLDEFDNHPTPLNGRVGKRMA
jgi:hypothetical protein